MNSRAMKRGFSLIELLVVISIIAILSSIGLVVYGQAQKIARDSRRKQDLKNIQFALEVFFQKNGRYPCVSALGNDADWGLSGNDKWWIHDKNCQSGENLVLDDKYINSISLPDDPKNNGQLPWHSSSSFSYAYWSPDNISFPGCPPGKGQYYILMARLETNDPEVKKPEDVKFCSGEPVITYPEIMSIGNTDDVNNLLILTSSK